MQRIPSHISGAWPLTDTNATRTGPSKYDRLIAAAQEAPSAVTVVAHPCDETSLRGAADAATARIIIPILVGPKAKIAAAARQHKVDISRFEIVDAAHTEEAAARA